MSAWDYYLGWAAIIAGYFVLLGLGEWLLNRAPKSPYVDYDERGQQIYHSENSRSYARLHGLWKSARPKKPASRDPLGYFVWLMRSWHHLTKRPKSVEDYSEGPAW